MIAHILCGIQQKGCHEMEQIYWSKMIRDTMAGRIEKPRISGLTMVIDTGVPITWMRDLLQMAADHMDYWKFAFASATVCPAERIMDKITLCQEYHVLAYPGGTSLEIAWTQGIWQSYLTELWNAGVKVVEVSDGTIDLPVRKRREIIRTAKKMGFIVLSEIGKKQTGYRMPITEQAELIHGDIVSGASFVIMEGRLGGLDVGVYDCDGNARDADVEALIEKVGPYRTRLIWEAPLIKQQTYYIQKYGNQVNLGNIQPTDVITLESLRRGFRSDTLRTALGLPDEDKMARKLAKEENLFSESATSLESLNGPTLWTMEKSKYRLNQ